MTTNPPRSQDWQDGYLAGLNRGLLVAKDYTGQGVLIAETILRHIRKFQEGEHDGKTSET